MFVDRLEKSHRLGRRLMLVSLETKHGEHMHGVLPWVAALGSAH